MGLGEARFSFGKREEERKGGERESETLSAAIRGGYAYGGGAERRCCGAGIRSTKMCRPASQLLGAAE
jgi:hypothetical protein